MLNKIIKYICLRGKLTFTVDRGYKLMIMHNPYCHRHRDIRLCLVSKRIEISFLFLDAGGAVKRRLPIGWIPRDAASPCG